MEGRRRDPAVKGAAKHVTESRAASDVGAGASAQGGVNRIQRLAGIRHKSKGGGEVFGGGTRGKDTHGVSHGDVELTLIREPASLSGGKGHEANSQSKQKSSVGGKSHEANSQSKHPSASKRTFRETVRAACIPFAMLMISIVVMATSTRFCENAFRFDSALP